MNDPHPQYSNEEIGRIGEDIYHRDTHSHVLPQHKGEFLVLEVEADAYVSPANSYSIMDGGIDAALSARFPRVEA